MTTTTASFQCPDCDHAPYPTKKGLGTHRRFAHGYVGTSRSTVAARRQRAAQARAAKKAAKAGQGEFKCEHCPRTFATQQGLAGHQSKHSDGIKKVKNPADAGRKKLFGKYPCQHCEFVAAWTGGLAKHMNSKHPELTTLTQTEKPKKGAHKIERPTKALALSNGHARQIEVVVEGHPDAVPDALVALTTGRLQELCRSVAYEHDVSPRLLTARVATLFYASSVR